MENSPRTSFCFNNDLLWASYNLKRKPNRTASTTCSFKLKWLIMNVQSFCVHPHTAIKPTSHFRPFWGERRVLGKMARTICSRLVWDVNKSCFIPSLNNNYVLLENSNGIAHSPLKFCLLFACLPRDEECRSVTLDTVQKYSGIIYLIWTVSGLFCNLKGQNRAIRVKHQTLSTDFAERSLFTFLELWF